VQEETFESSSIHSTSSSSSSTTTSSSSSSSSTGTTDRTGTLPATKYSRPQIDQRVESLPWSTQACDPLSHLPSYGQDSDTGSSLGSSGWDCTLALAGLRGSVSQVDSCFAGPFFKDVEKEVRVEEEDEVEAAEEEEEGPSLSPPVNEGIIFYNEVRRFPPRFFRQHVGLLLAFDVSCLFRELELSISYF